MKKKLVLITFTLTSGFIAWAQIGYANNLGLNDPPPPPTISAIDCSSYGYGC